MATRRGGRDDRPVPRPFDPEFVPTPRVINVADARLNRLLLQEPDSCASISEYAAKTGIDTTTVIELLGPYLDDGTLALEVCGDEIFLNTAPSGRPAPTHHVEVRPNLWEQLRERAPTELAYALWRLVRGLERAGWVVETKLSRIMFGMADVEHKPYLGVAVGKVIVPVLVYPSMDALASPAGLLAEYHQAGAAAVGIVCDQGALDAHVTAVRQWVLSYPVRPALSVLVLEAPRFNPTLLRPEDSAVSHYAVTRHTLASLDWDGT